MMADVITSAKLATQLIRALSLPDRVTAIDISMRVGEPAVLRVERYVGVDEAGELVLEMSRFGLVELDTKDSIERMASKVMEEIKARHQAAIDWLDAKHASNCYDLAAGCF